jgi:hypothetical protein
VGVNLPLRKLIKENVRGAVEDYLRVDGPSSNKTTISIEEASFDSISKVIEPHF